MSITFLCPHCSKSLKASADRVGRRAKCPQCGNDIVISAADRQKSAPAPRKAPPPTPPLGITPPESAVHGAGDRSQQEPAKRGKQPAKYSRSVVVAASFLTLIAGYVAGSMHPMKQMWGEFAKATKAIKDSYQPPPTMPESGGMMPSDLEAMGAFGGGGRAQLLAAGGSFDSMPPLLTIGEEHTVDDFSISLTDVRIGPSPASARTDAGSDSTEDQLLQCGFRVLNADAATSENEEENPEPLADSLPSFTISDDEGHFLRHLEAQSPGVVSTDGESQDGGQTRIESFQLPTPGTQELILIINLGEFGRKGLVGFRIPTSEIEGFATEPHG